MPAVTFKLYKFLLVGKLFKAGCDFKSQKAEHKTKELILVRACNNNSRHSLK